MIGQAHYNLFADMGLYTLAHALKTGRRVNVCVRNIWGTGVDGRK